MSIMGSQNETPCIEPGDHIILFVADNQAGFGYFKNFGKTRRQGLEAGLSVRAAAFWNSDLP